MKNEISSAVEDIREEGSKVHGARPHTNASSRYSEVVTVWKKWFGIQFFSPRRKRVMVVEGLLRKCTVALWWIELNAVSGDFKDGWFKETVRLRGGGAWSSLLQRCLYSSLPFWCCVLH